MTLQAIYIYTDERGKPVFRKKRQSPKRFCVEAAKYAGGRLHWKGGPGCIERYQPEWGDKALFNLPVVLDALRYGERIVIAEGERDASSVATLRKVAATTGHQGAAKFTMQQAEWLTMYGGKSPIVILRDSDDPGVYSAWLRYQRLTAAGVDRNRLAIYRVDGYADYTDAVARVGSSRVRLLREPVSAIKEAAFRVQTSRVAAYTHDREVS